ncbi:MAG: polyprenyl synthetase family protein [Treponema sp.]|jgi:octaprenyl-diphosphate synthase|nr:polyprenyl synthetase family protein [Treponema sp.]
MNQEYIQRLEKIEAELDRWLPENIEAAIKKTAWAENVFPGMGKNINAASLNHLLVPLRDILSRGGKRWRPLLMTLVCETLGGGEAAYPLAPLVEFCHNASLVHDDIEDNSDERRGKPAVHRIYGVDTAINSGSFFYFLALNCIESYAGGKKEFIYKLWAEYMRKLHLGQAMDISWHRNIEFVPNMEEYYVMCGMKTGSLARLAAELGVFAAGANLRSQAFASTEAARQLGEAAEKLGIGFQILDDVKNLTSGAPGKKRGDDIVEGKKSLPVLMYLRKYPERKTQIFNCFFQAKTNGIAAPETEEMIEVLAASGILAEAEEKGKAFLTEASIVFGFPRLDTIASAGGFSASEEACALLNGLISQIS